MTQRQQRGQQGGQCLPLQPLQQLQCEGLQQGKWAFSLLQPGLLLRLQLLPQLQRSQLHLLGLLLWLE